VKRGELYRVRHPSSADPRKSRVFVLVGRQAVIDSKFSSVTCAPIYSAFHGLSSQVAVGVDEGLKHDSAIHCDELVSIAKSALTDYIGSLSADKTAQLDRALAVALALDGS
jgi:mRNA interferase MazF